MEATLLVCLLMGLIAVSHYSYTYVSRWRPHWFEPKFIYEYKRAAELGDARAQYDLGHYYASVNDRDRWWSSDNPRDYPDYKEAARWYRMAAEQGYALAQDRLGRMHHNGTGVLKDYVQAHRWYNLAASQQTDKDRKKSVKRRDKLEEKMSREQVAEAERLAREFKPNPSEVTKSLQ